MKNRFFIFRLKTTSLPSQVNKSTILYAKHILTKPIGNQRLRVIRKNGL